MRSLVYKYNENEDYNDLLNEYKKELETAPIKKIYYDSNTISLEDLLSLYNAYSCISYQIEIKFNKKFINNIELLISNNIVNKLNDRYNDNEINKWEFEY